LYQLSCNASKGNKNQKTDSKSEKGNIMSEDTMIWGNRNWQHPEWLFEKDCILISLAK
jgi:hypothetical protein